MERVVEHRRHLLGGEARGSGEIGASHVADEEGVAGEHERRLVRRVGVAHQRRQALGRVARRFQEAQRDLADAELVAVAHRAVGERDRSARSEHHLGARPLRELAVAAHEVGVQVRLDHVADAKAVRLRLVQVFVDVAARVDDDRLALGPDHVGGLGQAPQVELLEVHRLPKNRTHRTRRHILRHALRQHRARGAHRARGGPFDGRRRPRGHAAPAGRGLLRAAGRRRCRDLHGARVAAQQGGRRRLRRPARPGRARRRRARVRRARRARAVRAVVPRRPEDRRPADAARLRARQLRERAGPPAAGRAAGAPGRHRDRGKRRRRARRLARPRGDRLREPRRAGRSVVTSPSPATSSSE